MCGILGIINFNDTVKETASLYRMGESLRHRGPDGEGYLLINRRDLSARAFYSKEALLDCKEDADICLAHRRLSIIDIDYGTQPMSNEDGKVWVVFNGQIYNYKELWDELESLGHKFKTDHSDTEVLVHAWEEWQEKCLERLNGMFAFAIIDLKRSKLFLARDRVGIKPLFVFHDKKNRFMFASELKALASDPAFPRKLDPAAVADYFRFGYVPSPKAIFENCYKLKPAHYILTSLDKDNFNIEQKEYWDLKYEPDYSMDEERWADLLEEKIYGAVKRQLISDVPIGLLLSGGVDSTIVALFMSKANKSGINTFSIGFEESGFDETPYAQQVADKFRTEHRKEMVGIDSIQALGVLTSLYDEPFSDPSAIPTYYLSKLARRHVTVALSGDGGDEGFGGYERYERALFYQGTMGLIPQPLREAVFSPVDRIFPENVKGKGLLRRVLADPESRYKSFLTQFDTQELFSKDFMEKIDSGYENPFFSDYFNKNIGNGYLDRMQYTDMKTYLPEDVLTKVDRASMASSLEVRVPLLDHTILEIAGAIPQEMRLKGRTTKFILRKILSRYFDAQFVDRKKMGFGVPVGAWIKTDWWDFVQDAVLNDADGIFNKKYVDELVSSHKQGLRNMGGRIYTLLFFKLWARNTLSG